MKITTDQANKIINLHIQASNYNRVFNAYVLIEDVLDILGIKHGRYNDIEKGCYMFWKINSISIEGDAE